MTGWPLAPLQPVRSIKVKLGLLVVVSVVVAAAVASLGDAGGVPLLLALPVTVLLALAVTQLLAVGMTSPLREMTEAARRMARGDYPYASPPTSADEVGELGPRLQPDGARPGRGRPPAPGARRHRLPRAAHPARRAHRGPGEPRRRRRCPRSRVPGGALAQAERMARLVEDLLGLARVDAGKAPLGPQPVAVAPLLADAVTEQRALARSVELRPPGGARRPRRQGRRRPAPPARREPAGQRARHSPAGGRVVVTARRRGGRFLLEVQDQGPGVAAEDRERVFEPFGTLSATEGGGGTGLGLAIARWVTDLHGGSIRFVDPGPQARALASASTFPSTRPTDPRARRPP